jgi:hypothetical protein
MHSVTRIDRLSDSTIECFQMRSLKQDPPQIGHIAPRFITERMAFEVPVPRQGNRYDGIGITPDGHDVELEDQSFMEVLASECIIIILKKLQRVEHISRAIAVAIASASASAIAMDWSDIIRGCDAHSI